MHFNFLKTQNKKVYPLISIFLFSLILFATGRLGNIGFSPRTLQEKIEKFLPLESKATFRLDKIVPAVVRIDCYFGEELGGGSGASAYWDLDLGQHWIITNAHVVKKADGSLADECWVYFPSEDGSFFKSVYKAGEIYTYDGLEEIEIKGVRVGGFQGWSEGGVDLALLKITEPGEDNSGNKYPFPTDFPDIFSVAAKTCRNDRVTELGEKLYILGYPVIGGENLTVTEGIVSGFEGPLNEWVKISAKTEYGNSGGIAVLENDGCLLGMPTFVSTGQLESLAGVLTYNFIFDFIDGYSERTKQD
ncbi:MAG: trypsin-like peptidase domain-containing protein [Candidatus Colwellbacteria bacterium]|nr:trypsin-like peptidase domain-containing protein [Candidatus Colwellbacteria bacterium]